MKTAFNTPAALAMSALALTALSGPAMAADTTATTSVEIFDYHVYGLGTDTYEGLRFELDGKTDSGFVYGADMRAGEVASAGIKAVELDAAYHFMDAIGPHLGYQYVDVAGFGQDRFMLGASADYDITPEISVNGKLTSDVDHFGDDVEFVLGGTYAVTDATRLSAEYRHIDAFGTDSDGGTLGIEHDISDRMFIDGKVRYMESGYSEITGASIGMGFRF